MKNFFILFIMLNFFQHLAISQNGKTSGEINRTIDSLSLLLKKDKEDTTKVTHLNDLSWEFRIIGNNPQALFYGYKAIEISQKIDYKLGAIIANRYVGLIYRKKSDYDSALFYFSISNKISKENEMQKHLALSFNDIGGIYYKKGNYSAANTNYFKALKIYEKLGEKRLEANCYGDIAEILSQKGDNKAALEYFEKAVKIKEEIGMHNSSGSAISGIATIYFFEKNYSKAIDYFKQALLIYEEIDDKSSISLMLNDIGSAYDEAGEYDNALEYYFKSMKISKELNIPEQITMNLYNIGYVYGKQKKFPEALQYLNEGLSIAKQINSLFDIKYSYLYLSETYQRMGNYERAYDYHKKYSEIKDTILNEESSRQIAEMNTKYQSEKKDGEIKLLNKDKEQQQQKQKYTMWGLALVIILAGVLLFAFYIKRRANLLLAKQKNEIEHQKEIIEDKHKEISDSINYAERIQRALLASKKMLDENLSDYFILFKPKDVVSGDFYWATKLGNNQFVIVTADSTGHGVPGAIMSILNIACLKEAVTKGITSPDLILNETRRLVIENLKNDGSLEGGKDGMDGSLLSFNFGTDSPGGLRSEKDVILTCASANNPIWIIRGNKLIEIKSDRMPIGKHDKDTIPFTLHTISLQKGDVVYTLTDGFADQFGGTSGKKFKYKQLQELLLSVTHEPMDIQNQKLNDVFDDWKGNLEQVDDMCIIGIRI